MKSSEGLSLGDIENNLHEASELADPQNAPVSQLEYAQSLRTVQTDPEAQVVPPVLQYEVHVVNYYDDT